MRKEYTVYMLRCSDDSYYIGMSSDLENRICAHQDGVYPDAYTRNKRPVKLVYSSDFQEVSEAIAWERIIKRWSRKNK